MERLPIKITPDPIVQAVVELRFEPLVQVDAVFHFISQSKVVKESFENATNTPVYELPPIVRNNEPGFRYSPYFHLEGRNTFEGYNLQVGPRVLSLVTNGQYQGSENFLGLTSELFLSIKEQEVVGNIERLGIRYIDLFEVNIFDNVILSITVPDVALEHTDSSIRLQFPKENGFTRVLRLASNAKVTFGKEKVERNGSLLDIDCFTENVPNEFFSDPRTILGKGHYAQKSLFYSLLKDEFLKSLDPQYED